MKAVQLARPAERRPTDDGIVKPGREGSEPPPRLRLPPSKGLYRFAGEEHKGDIEVYEYEKKDEYEDKDPDFDAIYVCKGPLTSHADDLSDESLGFLDGNGSVCSK